MGFKPILITGAIALVVCLAVATTQSLAATQTHAQAQVTPTTPPDGLSDLESVTFACPMAALNAAARQAAKAPSQGTYQFAYFKIISGTHHAAYEVHFKSNYAGETDLRYCVEMYCQQGWDPRTTKASIMLMSTQREGVTTHGDACGVHAPPVNRRAK
ncbi:MAG TPA: hypothetical protein VKA59_09360 [Vicinamibacterales bacterium]|nr:hypothetical protein [Vicinamibacterales bacterium]